jgi:5-methyltetrahydropteroyltriglutamate--homocysteine methyltransferase
MDRILTTHTGSLIRPAGLLPALRAIERRTPYDAGSFRAQLRSAVADVVRRQAEVGLDIVDDGELGKVGWINYFYNRVSGIEARTVRTVAGNALSVLPAGVDRSAFAGEEDLLDEAWRWASYWTDGNDYQAAGEGVEWVCTGPVAYDATELRMDLDDLRSALAGVDVVDAFYPVVAPGSIYWMRNEHYATDEEFLFAVADALAVEYRTVVDAGFLVHLDDAVLWHRYATIVLGGGTPEDWRRWAELRVEALNHALAGIDPARVRYHICSGSNHAPHLHDASLRDIIDVVLKVDAQALVFEQANARHEHEWRIWEEVHLPDDKVLVPGVVTHQTLMVEHPELVAQRLTRLAKLVGRERVMGGTDCGFAQMAAVKRVPEWTQWAKLEALVEGARLASRQLWAAPVGA